VSHGFAALQAINLLTDLTLTLTRLVTLLPRTRNVTLRVTFFLTGVPKTTFSVTVPRDRIEPITPAGGVADAPTAATPTTVRQATTPPNTEARRRDKDLRNRDMAAPFPCLLCRCTRKRPTTAPTLPKRSRPVNDTPKRGHLCAAKLQVESLGAPAVGLDEKR
jgi:hypothetical protein